MTTEDNGKTHSIDIEFGSNKQTNLGLSGKTAIVHKTGEEGGLLIDAFSGVVIPGQTEAPEWAAGYSCALLSERHGFYTKRLGANYADAHKSPEAYNADDLSWIGLDDEGLEVEVPASLEYRQGVVKAVLIEAGLITDTDAAHVDEFLGAPHAEILMDRERTQEEASAIEQASTEGFQKLTGTNNE